MDCLIMSIIKCNCAEGPVLHLRANPGGQAPCCHIGAAPYFVSGVELVSYDSNILACFRMGRLQCNGLLFDILWQEHCIVGMCSC